MPPHTPALFRRGAGCVAIAVTAILAACGDDDPTGSAVTDETTTSTSTSTANAAPSDESTTTDPATDAAPSEFAGNYTIDDPDTGTSVTVSIDSGVRRIVANGLPNHDTGDFPGEGNPNAISAQSYDFEFPAEPTVGEPTAYNVPQPFGIAVNGVVMDPFAAEWFENDPSSGWQLEALAAGLGIDDANAHVQPTGAYHYHAAPTPLVSTTSSPVLLGWAGDGFPIYSAYGYEDADDPTSEVRELEPSFALRSGQRTGGPGGSYDGSYVEDYEYVEGSGDLDECNGRDGVTPEYPDGTYYYVATNTWPYLGRCLVGEIAASFVKGPR